ncbi:MAG TPA: CPBP family intramembrane glutamic endopeptidase [Terracidiphilus sp.]|nr:CPBP family intramembrane glutamic endopeptidase [Terracidiphilus sp.]
MQAPPPEAPDEASAALRPELAGTPAGAMEYRGLRWMFIGKQGLRAGWSVFLFIVLTFLFMMALSAAVGALSGNGRQGSTVSLSPIAALVMEAISVLSILGAGTVVALIERRRVLDYNLIGPRRCAHFLGGLAAGFLALSALVGALAWGGWLHFGPVALSGTQILGSGAVWGAAFLFTGLFEEGSFRCYLQFTLTRGINFWWAMGIVAAFCVAVALRDKGNGAWGIYVMALLGVVPCLILHLKRTQGSGFWQAAWVTSTFFGFLHTGNAGENWIGIAAAGAIGFVFCVSVWVTGSAWWAIGCHAAWDWAETFFYGTANSGLVPKGHFLSTAPAGSAFWSGGTDGPEGSVLVFAVILLLLAALIAIYGRRRPVDEAASATELTAE